MAKKVSIIDKLPKNKVTLAVSVLVGLVFFVYVIFAIGIYKYGWDNSATRKVANVLPYPVEKVGDSFVSHAEFTDKLDPLVNYQKSFNNVDFTSEEGKKKLQELKSSVLDQLAEEKIIAAESKKKNITISQKELDDSFNDLIKSNGGEEKVKENLNKYYSGMSVADFKQQYKDKMLRQKLADAYSKDEGTTSEAKTKADQVLAEIKKGGDFAELAKKNSQDNSASNGGDLGFFTKGKMVPEFEKAAFALEKGAVSEVVKTVYGYHIIKVTEKKGDEIKASHILVKTKDFNDWLKDRVKNGETKRYLKI